MGDLIERLRKNAGYRDERWQCITDPALLAKAADEIAALRERVAELEGLIRECRLADSYAARTGDEARWDRAFSALCRAEKVS